MSLFEQLQQVCDKCVEEEFQMMITYYPQYGSKEPFCVDLEKGSSYSGGLHLKTSGRGATLEEAFKTAIDNFPKAPIDNRTQWATQRLAPPNVEVIEDGEYSDVP